MIILTDKKVKSLKILMKFVIVIVYDIRLFVKKFIKKIDFDTISNPENKNHAHHLYFLGLQTLNVNKS